MVPLPHDGAPFRDDGDSDAKILPTSEVEGNSFAVRVRTRAADPPGEVSGCLSPGRPARAVRVRSPQGGRQAHRHITQMKPTWRDRQYMLLNRQHPVRLHGVAPNALKQKNLGQKNGTVLVPDRLIVNSYNNQ